jgi:hypothetical protein
MITSNRDSLDLSNRKLTAVPPRTWRRTLRVLNLFQNNLNRLPPEIAQLRELRVRSWPTIGCARFLKSWARWGG